MMMMMMNCKITTFLILFFKDAGESSISNLDKLRHAKGSTSTAQLRLKMQKVN